MVAIIFILFIVLIQLSNITTSEVIKIIPIGGLLFLTVKYTLSIKKFNYATFFKVNYLVIIFLIINSIGLFRSNNPNDTLLTTFNKVLTLNLLLTGFTGVVSYYLNKSDIEKKNINNIIYFIILPFCLLALLNWFLHLLNIKVRSSGFIVERSQPAIILSYIGLNVERIEFPLSSGINSYSMYIGGIFSIALPLLTLHNEKKILLLICNIILFATLLFSDSRTAIIYPILITLCILIIKQRKTIYKAASILPYLVILGPIAFAFALPLLSNIPALSFLARSENDFETGNSRLFIWLTSFYEFISFKPIHVIGYGIYGHYGSGASKIWANLFTGYENPETAATSHNSLFSILFDYGYIGLFVYILLLVQLLKRIRLINYSSQTISYILFAFFIYNVIGGITESFIGIYLYNYLLLFYIICITINAHYFKIVSSQKQIRFLQKIRGQIS